MIIIYSQGSLKEFAKTRCYLMLETCQSPAPLTVTDFAATTVNCTTDIHHFEYTSPQQQQQQQQRLTASLQRPLSNM